MKRVLVKGRKFVTEDDKPFFYTACTGWELFHKLTFEEATVYIDNRAAKGFNVIQAVAVAELDGLNVPSYEGRHLPFSQHRHAVHQRRVLRARQECGSVRQLQGTLCRSRSHVGLLFRGAEQSGSQVRPIFDEDNIAPFIDYLARKMSGLGIIWMLGGDRSYLERSHKKVMRLMADGIRSVSGHVSAHHGAYPRWQKPVRHAGAARLARLSHLADRAHGRRLSGMVADRARLQPSGSAGGQCGAVLRIAPDHERVLVHASRWRVPLHGCARAARLVLERVRRERRHHVRLLFPVADAPGRRRRGSDSRERGLGLQRRHHSVLASIAGLSGGIPDRHPSSLHLRAARVGEARSGE